MKLLSRIFNRKLFLIIVLTLLLPVAPGFAGKLRADISLQLGPGVSLYYSDYPRYGYSYRPPVYYAPPPVYYAPPPVYYAPPPPRSYWRSNRHGHHHYRGDRGYRRDRGYSHRSDRGYSRRDRRW